MTSSADSPTSVPLSERFKTQYTEQDVFCPGCRAQWSPVVASVVNVGETPQGREGILRGTMHQSRCPACKRPMALEQVFEYYDPDRNLLIDVRPKWEFKAGGGEEIYWKRLEQFVLKHAEDDVRVDVVFGFDELIEKHLGGQAAVAAALARADRERAERLPTGSLIGDEQADGTANSDGASA